MKRSNNKTFYIDDIKLGQKFHFNIKYTSKIHKKFKEFSGDHSKIHTDRKFAINNGFENVIGYAFFLTTHLSNLLGMCFPGGSELCVSQNNKFIKTFYIGDKLTYVFKIIQKNHKYKLLTIDLLILNQNNAVILKGDIVLKLSLDENC